MRRKIVLSIFSILLLVGCGEKYKKNSIAFFNGISFELDTSESEVKLFGEVKNNYNKIIENKVPLFKAIKAKNYTIYLGIPYMKPLDTLCNESFIKYDTMYNSNKTAMTCYKKGKIAGNYTGEYVFKKDNNLIYVLGVSASKSFLDTIFTEEKISKKILITNED